MSSSEEDADEVPELVLDPLFPGRIALFKPLGDPNNDPFEFGSFMGALPDGVGQELLEDCALAFTSTSLSDVEDEDSEPLGVSSGETFWVPAVPPGNESNGDAPPGPRCGLEAIALQIFNFHVARLGLVAGVHYDPSRSGAEWWTQCIDSDAEIGFHWGRFSTLDIFASWHDR